MSNKGKNGKPETVETDVVQHDAPETEQASTGSRIRRAFMMKNFLPSQDFINKNVVAGGKGTKVMIGRIVGIVTGTSDKTGTLPDGTPSQSVVLNGQFEAESYLDGEVSAMSSVFFPNAFAEYVKAMFVGDKELRAVEIDCDVGLEATGKSIPFSWVIVNHREGIDMTPLKRLKASRERPALAFKPQPAQLEAPK